MKNKTYIVKVALPGCEEGAKFVKVDNNLLPPNYSKETDYYAPEGDMYPLYEEKHIIASPYFREENEPPSLDDVKYLTQKRNFALERFVSDVKMDASLEAIQDRFNIIKKLTGLLRTAEDELLVYTLTRKVEELQKKYGV